MEKLPYGVSFIPEISHWTGSFYLHCVRRDGNKLYVPKEISWIEQDEGLINPSSAIRTDVIKNAQKLFDDMYAMGFRPSDGKNNDLVIKSKDEHLADLRLILKSYLPSIKE